MKIAASILATASAVQMVHPGYQEVAIAVHVTEHDGMPVDEWIAIDAIQDENPEHWEDHDDGSDGDWSDDDHDEPESNHCEHIYTYFSTWHDASTGEDHTERSTECYDDCIAAGGRVEEKEDQGENVDEWGTVHGYYWELSQECIVDDCEGFEQSYTYTDDDGNDVTNSWCDYSCMVSGGHLVEETLYDGRTEAYCFWGEHLEDCYDVIIGWDDEPICDSWCIPNSGRHDENGACVWDNIEEEM